MDRPDIPLARVETTLDLGGTLAIMRFSGAIRGDDLIRAQRGLNDALNHRTVTGLILDARASRPDYTPGQLLDALEACLESASPHRCAFVTSEIREDTLKLIESAGVPFAVRVRGFMDMEEAWRWAAGQ
jgi:hypothetical protein